VHVVRRYVQFSSLTYWSATRPHNLQALPIDERVFVAGVVRVISLNAVGSKIGGEECLMIPLSRLRYRSYIDID